MIQCPRQIDGIPETEIIKAYLGPHKNQFKETLCRCWSPTSQSEIWATFFERKITPNLKLRVSYTRTASAIRLTAKHKNIFYPDRWIDRSEWLIKVNDPKGVAKLRFILTKVNDCLNSSNHDSSDENSDESHNLESQTIS